MRKGYVYIMSSKSRALYVGVTNNLDRRLFEHQHSAPGSFTHRYNIRYLVYYEVYSSIITAIEREKQIKKWRREKKVKLIESENPEWKDLSELF